MKKYLTLLLGLALLFTGCEKANKVNDYLAQTVWKSTNSSSLEFLGNGKVALVYGSTTLFGTYTIIDESTVSFNLTVSSEQITGMDLKWKYQFKTATVTLTTMTVTLAYSEGSAGSQDVTWTYKKQ